MLVSNPATAISRIAPTNSAVKPVPGSPIGADSGKVIPLLVLDDVPLDEAIIKIAGAAGLSISFDPKLSPPAFERNGMISIRWQKITARQALAALLDNYGLVMTVDAPAASARITLGETGAQQTKQP